MSATLLKRVLEEGRDAWDHPRARATVRQNFGKVLACKTAALGAEVFASATEIKTLYHTCKSRSCPTCGQRATADWLREQYALLPDVRYAAVVFTMPDVLWPIFKQNRHLLHDLPALGANVIQQWYRLNHGVDVLVMIFPHTFGRHLNFNSHLHVLVSAGGLRRSDNRWLTCVPSQTAGLMHMWRYAVIFYLREAVKKNLVTSTLSTAQLLRLLKEQYERWWNIHVDRFSSKQHTLKYAARYVRRLPIAMGRLMAIENNRIRFWTKDTKTKKIVVTECPLEEFVHLLGAHVPERYAHNIRYFGLASPRLKQLLRYGTEGRCQTPGIRPPRLRWRQSIFRASGKDPLVDSHGERMHWVRRLRPLLPAVRVGEEVGS